MSARSRMKTLFGGLWQLTASQKRTLIKFIKSERASERAKALRLQKDKLEELREWIGRNDEYLHIADQNVISIPAKEVIAFIDEKLMEADGHE